MWACACARARVYNCVGVGMRASIVGRVQPREKGWELHPHDSLPVTTPVGTEPEVITRVAREAESTHVFAADCLCRLGLALPVHPAPHTALEEPHHVLRERPGLVREDVVDLSQLCVRVRVCVRIGVRVCVSFECVCGCVGLWLGVGVCLCLCVAANRKSTSYRPRFHCEKGPNTM